MTDKLIKLISEKPKTPFAAPEQEIYIWESNVLDVLNVNELTDIILSNERNVIEKYPAFDDGQTGLGNDSLTSRYPHFNLFQWKQKGLNEAVRKTHDKFISILGYKNTDLYGQCWANVLRISEQIKSHSHYNDTLCYLGGHICTKVKDTHTHYVNPYTKQVYSSKNEIGKITLFPNWIDHYTDYNKGPQERVTIAFDLFTPEFYNTKVKEEKKSHWEKL